MKKRRVETDEEENGTNEYYDYEDGLTNLTPA